jgi:hypothetical protein
VARVHLVAFLSPVSHADATCLIFVF